MYSQPMFQRHREDLLIFMQRNQKKKRSTGQSPALAEANHMRSQAMDMTNLATLLLGQVAELQTKQRAFEYQIAALENHSHANDINFQLTLNEHFHR